MELFPIDHLDTHLQQWLITFFLVLARVAGFVVRAPLFSDPFIPHLAKSGVIMGFTILLMPVVPVIEVSFSEYNFIIGLTINFVLGYFIGFIADLVTHVAEVAGEVIDVQSGLSSAVIVTGGVNATVFNNTLRLLTLIIILYAGGMEMAILSFKFSFTLFPLLETDLNKVGVSLDSLINFTRDVLILGVTTASPVLVIIVFTDIILGLMSRAAQQINPFQLSFSIKPIISLIVVMFSLPLIQGKIMRVMEKGTNIYGLYELENNPKAELEKLRVRLKTDNFSQTSP